jgi:membrane fusion protein, heavy metal efflux system
MSIVRRRFRQILQSSGITMNRAILVILAAAVLGALGLGYAVGWHKSLLAPQPIDPLEAHLRALEQEHSHGTGVTPHTHADGEEHAGDREHTEEEAHDHIELSDQAAGNIGLKMATLESKPYQRTITIPAVVVERPGASRVEVSAPLTGIVTKVFHTSGESVGPQSPLFQLRLTHEELVATQREYLVTLEELDVIAREITRLEEVTASGAVAGKSLLERQYEQQKLNASLKALREALLLHGLGEELVDSISAERKLVPEITVNVPDPPLPNPLQGARCCFTIQELKVNIGKHVTAGDTLAELTDYTNLYIEGRAFQRDASAIENAAAKEWQVTAELDSGGSQVESKDLSIAFVANEVDVESRALHFYVELPNELMATHEKQDGRLYSQWKYRPGMRGELFVPAERWTDQLVVPVNAVVEESAESFIFVVHGTHYDRAAVRVLQKDQRFAVIAENGRVKAGEQYVMEGAYQMHLAIKNQSGGAADPHAGHTH